MPETGAQSHQAAGNATGVMQSSKQAFAGYWAEPKRDGR